MHRSKAAILALLACCACNLLPGKNRFAVKCSGNEHVTGENEGLPPDSIDQRDVRTYVFDMARRAIYRVDPNIVGNICSSAAECDIEITVDRAAAITSETKTTSSAGMLVTQLQFSLDRRTGELKFTRTMEFKGSEFGNIIKMEGNYSCISTDMPDFKVPST
jgi:hypothetical protein